MKLGLAGYPPLTFRAISLVAGRARAGVWALVALKVPFHGWLGPPLARAALAGGGQHVLSGTPASSWRSSQLSSGRAAILGLHHADLLGGDRRHGCFRDRPVGARTGWAWAPRRWAWRCCCGMSSPAWRAGPPGVAAGAGGRGHLGAGHAAAAPHPKIDTAQTLTHVVLDDGAGPPLVMVLLAVLLEQPRWRMPPGGVAAGLPSPSTRC
jgi:hypothetical protein